MKKSIYVLCLLFVLGLIAACGGEDVADDPKLSSEAKTVVEEVGGPFSESEFKEFIEILPDITGLTARTQQDMGEMSAEALSAKILAEVKAKGWDEERFMYVYSHAMTMVNVEQMDVAMKEMKNQMEGMPEEQKKMMEQMMGQQLGAQAEAFQAEVDKQVPASEQAIIKEHMNDLCSALGIPRR